MAELTQDLVTRLTRRGPRYTSYPTAAAFREDFDPSLYTEALAALGQAGGEVSLYLHLPFCRSLCHYCACNVIVTQSATVAEDYLDLIAREAERLQGVIGATVPVTQLHLGGGTPTFFAPDQLDRLLSLLEPHFGWDACEERAVEVDPRVTTPAHLEALAQRGFNRISLGVQDFDPQVQFAINRTQSLAETAAVVQGSRELAFGGVNLDLVYGLPFQTPDSLARTLDAVEQLAPDRIALYGYAHLPSMRPAQRRFETKGYPLPDSGERITLFRLAVDRLLAAGFVHLGLDHFARPEDELALAAQDGRLHRNFQGYTVRRADDVIALGVSGISEVGGVFAQNHKELEAYWQALGDGSLPIARGWASSPDDRRRREVIMQVMTGQDLPSTLREQFPQEADELDRLEADGLVVGHDGGWRITETGRYFLRNLAMVFDRYLDAGARFSRTV